MSWVVKERHIDSVTCANRIAKILVLLQKNHFKSAVFIFGYFINMKRPNFSTDIVAVSLENNAALNGSDWQGVDWLIGWLHGRTVIIRAHKSHAFSQIIPGLKAPIVITGCGVLLSEPPHGDNNATIQGHSLLQAGQFQV